MLSPFDPSRSWWRWRSICVDFLWEYKTEHACCSLLKCPGWLNPTTKIYDSITADRTSSPKIFSECVFVTLVMRGFGIKLSRLVGQKMKPACCSVTKDQRLRMAPGFLSSIAGTKLVNSRDQTAKVWCCVDTIRSQNTWESRSDFWLRSPFFHHLGPPFDRLRRTQKNSDSSHPNGPQPATNEGKLVWHVKLVWHLTKIKWIFLFFPVF